MKWEKVKLGNCIDISKGKKHLEVTDTSAFPYLQIDDVNGTQNPKYTAEKGVDVTVNDLIIVWDGANAGKVGIGLNGMIGSTLSRLRIKNNCIAPRFLFWYLNSNFEFIKSQRTGATIPHVSTPQLNSMCVPLPPLSIQQNIASILDHADNLRRLNRQLLQKYDELAQSVFLEMFGNEEALLRLPIKPLKEVSEVVSGVTKGRKFNGKATVEVPYMRVANVQDAHIDLTEIKTIVVLPDDVEKFRLKYGDLLLTEGGDPDKLGRGAVWKFDVQDCIHQNHIFRVRANPEILHWDYLSALLGSKYGKKYFLKAAKQTTGIASINSTQLRAFPVPIPPIELQNRYFLFLEKFEKQKSQALIDRDKGEMLFQSLMQRAFKEK